MSQQYVGRVDLYTFKEGLLSRVAHDLKLSLGRFELTSADGGLTFVGWPDSIEVTGVMRGGRVYPDQLSGRDKNTIRSHIQRDILRTGQFETVEFTGQLGATGVTGDLKMLGQSRAIRCGWKTDGDQHHCRIELKPSRWGIKPFKALMGAIRLQDRVVIELAVSPAT